MNVCYLNSMHLQEKVKTFNEEAWETGDPWREEKRTIEKIRWGMSLQSNIFSTTFNIRNHGFVVYKKKQVYEIHLTLIAENSQKKRPSKFANAMTYSLSLKTF